MRGSKAKKKESKAGRFFSRLTVVFVWILTLTAMVVVGTALVRVREIHLVRKAEAVSPDASGPLVAPLPYDKPILQGKRAAIILDDLGWDMAAAKQILAMKIPLTLAVLPYRQFSYEVALEASQKGKEVILHLPLQPRNYPGLDPGVGCLLISMDRRAIQSELDALIASLPFCVGVNNHMGSLFTERREPMAGVFSVLKEKNLFFVDSLVTPDSIARETARSFGVRFAARTHFLDDKRDEDAIVKQLCRLADFAAREGAALGIGHPYPETLAAIPKALPAFAEKGVELVRASEIVVTLKRDRGEAS